MTSHSESIIREVMASEVYRKAVATLTAEHDRTVEDIIALTQVAAPSFQEATRAGAFLAMAEAHGLRESGRSMRRAMSPGCVRAPAMGR